MCLNVIKVYVDNVFFSNEYRFEYNKKKISWKYKILG